MALGRKNKKKLVGVDISSSSIKLVELGRKGGGFVLERYAIEPLASGDIIDKDIKRIQAVAKSIKRALLRGGISNKNAIAAVPSSIVITKEIQVESGLPEHRKEMMVELEVEKHVPYPLEEIRIDYEEQAQSNEESEESTIVFTATRIDAVDKLVECLELAGLDVEVVDVDIYAIERAFVDVFKSLDINADDSVAVVDIGATMTTLHVMKEQKIVFSREQMFGSHQLTEYIQSRYQLSLEEAETEKSSGGAGLDDDYIPEILEPFKDELTQQINRALQFYLSSHTNNYVEHVLLCGGGAAIDGLETFVQERLDVTTSVFNPFLNMSVSSKMRGASGELAKDTPSLVIASGLALRSFE